MFGSIPLLIPDNPQRPSHLVIVYNADLQALTIGGALMILISMAWLEYRGRPATTRTRLVQALVVSDLILG